MQTLGDNKNAGFMMQMAEKFQEIARKMRDLGYKPSAKEKNLLIALTPKDLFG